MFVARSRPLIVSAALTALALLPRPVDAADFESGALIIPMDTTYQDDGMFLAFGLVGYLGFLLSQAWRTRHQPSVSGLWAHTVVIIGLTQMPYYLQVPQQMFTILVAAALAIRLRHPGQARLADR